MRGYSAFVIGALISLSLAPGAFSQTKPAEPAWKDGFLEKEYAATADDIDKALDAVFAKCVPFEITVLQESKGIISSYGVGDKNGRWRTNSGASWNGISTIEALDIKDGGTVVSVMIVTNGRTTNVGFKVGDGHRKSSEVLHSILSEKLPKPASQPVSGEAGKPPYSPRAEGPDAYLPLRVGNEWTYRARSAGTETSSKLVYRVTATEKLENANCFVFERENTHQAPWIQHLEVTPGGLQCHRSKVGGIRMDLSPPQTFIKFPLEVGESWEYADAGLTLKWRVKAEEEVKVPAGTFRAMRIEGEGSARAGSMSAQYASTIWVSKGVGIVKENTFPGLGYKYAAELESMKVERAVPQTLPASSPDVRKEYYESGQLMLEGRFQDGKEVGIHKEYWENGQLKREASYKSGKLHGPCRTHHRSGRLERESTFKDGVAEGVGRLYYENGRVRNESTYRDGRLEGISKAYRESGELEAELAFKADNQDGTSRTYYQNGQIQQEAQYKNGKLHGKCRKYSENGVLTEEAVFENGVRVK